MKILAVDTALGACSAAVAVDGKLRARRFELMARGHAEALAPMVESMMREAGLGFAELDRLAVTTGPGTFTGQRVGLAFMRGLALTLGKPLAGITTLDAMAAEALARTGAAWAIAAADARRGEIYFAARAAGGRALIGAALLPLAAAIARLASLDTPPGVLALAGTATEAVTPLLAARGLEPRDSKVRQPDALFVAHLAARAPEPQAPPRPLYLRAPDAKLPTARP